MYCFFIIFSYSYSSVWLYLSYFFFISFFYVSLLYDFICPLLVCPCLLIFHFSLSPPSSFSSFNIIYCFSPLILRFWINFFSFSCHVCFSSRYHPTLLSYLWSILLCPIFDLFPYLLFSLFFFFSTVHFYSFYQLPHHCYIPLYFCFPTFIMSDLYIFFLSIFLKKRITLAQGHFNRVPSNKWTNIQQLYNIVMLDIFMLQTIARERVNISNRCYHFIFLDPFILIHIIFIPFLPFVD